MPSQDSINTLPLTTNGPVSHASVTVSEPLVTVSGDPFSELDPIEIALADALMKAAASNRFDVVAQLARELEARRLAREKVEVTEQEQQRES